MPMWLIEFAIIMLSNLKCQSIVDKLTSACLDSWSKCTVTTPMMEMYSFLCMFLFKEIHINQYIWRCCHPKGRRRQKCVVNLPRLEVEFLWWVWDKWCFSYSHYSYCLLPPTNKVWGKVMFLHLSVILFTVGRGYTPPMQTPSGRHPLGRHPLVDTPWQTPPGQTPPGRHPPASRRLLLQTVRILMECILVSVLILK